MASSGPNSPSSNSTSGWSAPTETYSSNNTYCSIQFNSGGGVSGAQVNTGYGFSIPSGATIDGIVVEIEKKASDNSIFLKITDLEVKLVKGGTAGGTNKALGTGWSTTESYITYGASNDLWGLSWTDSDINASNFGVHLKVKGTVVGKAQVFAYVDHVTITVYYTAGGGAVIQTALLVAGD